MKITNTGIIYSGENNLALSSCSFPGICNMADGTILATFKGAETKGPFNNTDRTVTCISKDGGKTWSEPIEFFAPPVVDGKPTTLRLIYIIVKGEKVD